MVGTSHHLHHLFAPRQHHFRDGFKFMPLHQCHCPQKRENARRYPRRARARAFSAMASYLQLLVPSTPSEPCTMTTLILCYYAFCAQPGEDLELLDEAEVVALKENGALPCVGLPTRDLEGSNQLTCMYIAQYENGYELTLLFLDEDRPNACADCCLDFLRRPLFGRYFDIETVFLMKNDTNGDGKNGSENGSTDTYKMEFPGTHSADQKWNVFSPKHTTESVHLSLFEKRTREVGKEQPQQKKDQHPTLYVNTWNHLMSESNNNPDLEMTYMFPVAGKKEDVGSAAVDAYVADTDAEPKNSNTYDSQSFILRRGSRKDVDGRFKGIISSMTTVMTEEQERRLGKRLDEAECHDEEG